jgi:hypothetical protein
MAGVLAGATLTRSDWTPDNVLVSGHRAWLIDWAWPTLGTPWTDPAGWVLRLMASGGHTSAQAEQQAVRLPAFTAANPAHIDLFAAANIRLRDEIASSSNSDRPAAMPRPPATGTPTDTPSDGPRKNVRALRRAP